MASPFVRPYVLLATLAGAGAGFWGGCSSPVDEPGSTLPGTCESQAPIIPAQKTDILFVIDNSDSSRGTALKPNGRKV